MCGGGVVVHVSDWPDEGPDAGPDDGDDDGLGVLVGVATGTQRPASPEVLGKDAGSGWMSSLRLPAGPRGARLGAALVVGVVLVALVAAVAAGGGAGSSLDPDLPLSGEAAAVPSGRSTGAAASVPAGEDVAAGEGGGRGAGTPAGSTTDASLPGSGAEVVVHVAGAVVTPGVHRLVPGARVHDAVVAAGGPRSDADLERVNLAAPLGDGSQVYVPVVGVAGSSGEAGAQGVAAGGSAAGAPAGDGSRPVSLSVADAEGLQALPGVGPATAAAIIAHRDEHGPFTSVEELLDVRGIGPVKFAALRDLVVP